MGNSARFNAGGIVCGSLVAGTELCGSRVTMSAIIAKNPGTAAQRKTVRS
jgi:hypothetical protein